MVMDVWFPTGTVSGRPIITSQTGSSDQSEQSRLSERRGIERLNL